jgi:tetratricopeptide (TPR) repeat protein
MPRSTEKAIKPRVSRAKTVEPKRRSATAAKSTKATAAGNADQAKGRKRAAAPAKAKKASRAPVAPKKPAVAKKTVAKGLKASQPAKAAATAPSAKKAAGKKPQPAPKQQAPPAPESRRKPVMAKSVPPPPPPAVDKQAELAAKAERQLEQRQAEHYEKAVEFFNARRFARALPLMDKAAEGPNATLRHRAHVYADICRKQIGAEKVELKTADDHYNYGVKLMNDRRLDDAQRHLQRALRLAPKAGYVHYANAVLSALQGNVEAAYGNLKRAIEIDPLNRVLALNDAELGSVVGHPPIAHLLHQGGDS